LIFVIWNLIYLWENVAAVEGALEVLKNPRKKNNCYMATNAKDFNKVYIQKALKRVGLNKYIKEIYCYRSVGYETRKPPRMV